MNLSDAGAQTTVTEPPQVVLLMAVTLLVTGLVVGAFIGCSR